MPNKLNINFNTDIIKNTLMNFIVPLVCIGISGVLGFTIIYPSAVNMPQLQASLNEKTKVSSLLKAKAGVLEKLVDYKSVVDEDLSLVDKLIPSEGNIPYLLNQIDHIARNSGLTVSRLNYGVGNSPKEGKDAGSGAEIITVNLGVTGSYTQLVTFLQETEKSARLLDISNLRFTINETSGAEGNISASCILNSPFMLVNSKASTDDPINLNIADSGFVTIINRVKGFSFYDNLVVEPNTVEATEKPIDELLNDNEAAEQATPSAAPTGL